MKGRLGTLWEGARLIYLEGELAMTHIGTTELHDAGRRERFLHRLCLGEDGAGFTELAEELRGVVPHRFFAYAVVRTIDARIERLYNIDFPHESLKSLHLREESECEVVRHWLQRREPVVVEEKLWGVDLDQLHLSAAAHTDSRAFAIHAQLDLTGSRAIAFCFGDVPRTSAQCVAEDLKSLTPYLYAYAVHAIRGNADARRQRVMREHLTRREAEVLRWVYHGKTNEEVAAILGISVFTVKNHVQRILLKLDATNRVQAVSRAASAGMLEDGEREVTARKAMS
jgi:DNA-binding CsgD family transcriptional regulator